MDDQQERTAPVLLFDGSRSEAGADRAPADYRKSSTRERPEVTAVRSLGE
jgi:hypothetical protein